MFKSSNNKSRLGWSQEIHYSGETMSLVFKLIVFISFVCHVNACIYKTWRHYFNLKHFLSVLEKVCIFITCPYTKDRSLLGLFNHCHLWPFHISFTSSQWTFKKRMQFFSKWICFKIRSHVAVFFYVTNSESMKQMHVSCSGMPFQDYNVSSFFLCRKDDWRLQPEQERRAFH